MQIDIHQLSVKLGGQTVLHGVDLSIPSGSAVALVGQSGTGKTTLLRTMAGLIEPDGGQVLIDSQPPAFHYGSTHLAFLFQKATLWQHLSLRANLELVYELHGRVIDHAHIDAQLAMVGLSAAAALFPYQLSVGMAARAAIARALCLPPRVLLMDEPFAALDPVRRATLNTTIRATCRRLGATSVLVTHDVVEALQYADLVIVLAPSHSVDVFDTRALPTIDDAGNLPAPVRALRDRILANAMSAPAGLAQV
ncbi:MAG: ATP-binding cassette domain-containing protein [Pseudomonadota bacterium]|nr:ATP-binding cassette domain-containing protein [Pseudomonadota bacterium]